MRRVRLVALATALALLAACGGDGSSGSQSAEGLDEVTLVLDYLMDGNKAPFVLGREKGFFEDQGIDITSIEESGGSSEAVKVVGNGRFDFGTAYAGEYATGVDKGVPIMMVANYLPLDQSVIFVRAESDILAIPDLQGKKLIVGSDDNRIVLERVLEAGGADVSTIEIIEVDAQQVNGSFLVGQADAVKLPFEAIAALTEAEPGLELRAFTYGEQGFNTMGQGLFTTTEMVENNPDLVKRMVEAAMQSYRYAAEHPDEVAEVVSALYPEASAEVLQTEMNIAFALLATPNTSGHPFGYMAVEDWQSTLDLLTESGVISGDKPVEEFFTNDFIGDWEPLEPQGEFADILSGG